MKRNRLFLLLTVVAMALLVVATTAALGNPRVSASPPPRAAEELVIGLAAPDPNKIDVSTLPPGASRKLLAYELARQQAQPILNQLQRLQQLGRVQSYSLDAENFAVRVEAVGGLDGLGVIEGASFVEQAGSDISACAVGNQNAAIEMVLAKIAWQQKKEDQSKQRNSDDDLNIAVYVTPGSSYTSVTGYALPDAEVHMRVWRDDRVVIEDYTYSYSDGDYYFWPSYNACLFDGYSWQIFPGDVVEIQSGSQTEQTHVVSITAQFDAATKKITGKTKADGSMFFYVNRYSLSDEECYSTEGYHDHIYATSDGTFTIDLQGQSDINNRASVSLTAMDENGNSTFHEVAAHNLAVDAESSDFYGTLPPNGMYSAELRRSGTSVGSTSGYTDYSGYFYGWFDEGMLPGDVVVTTGRGIELRYTVVVQNLQLDHVNNRLIGTTAANHFFQAYFESDPYRSVNSSCYGGYECRQGQSAADGSISLGSPIDLRRGDYASVNIYDTVGNYQRINYVNSPVIQVSVGSSQVAGIWTARYVDLIVQLRDSSDALKDEYTSYAYYDGTFYAYFNEPIVAGDMVVVTDGTDTLSMTVQDLGGRLNSNTNRLTIQGPDIDFVLNYNDSDGFYGSYDCSEETITGGTFVLDQNDVGPGDYANATFVGPDGNYTSRNYSAFITYLGLRQGYIDGALEALGQTATVRQRRNGAVIFEDTYQPDEAYFYFGGEPMQAGDQIEVVAGDTSATITVPVLTAALDTATNSTVGQGPHNDFVLAYLYRSNPYGRDYVSDIAYAEDNGNYAYSWNGWYWYHDCSNISAGNRCSSAGVDYRNPQGHYLYLNPPDLPPAPPDAFETDNTPAQAKPYSLTNHTHTFHAEEDVDWVKFTVSAEEAGRTYRIDAQPAGWYVYTEMTLYAADGQTELATGRQQLVWESVQAGTYLIRITPEEYSGVSCDSFYDLYISSMQSFLPSVSR